MALIISGQIMETLFGSVGVTLCGTTVGSQGLEEPTERNEFMEENLDAMAYFFLENLLWKTGRGNKIRFWKDI